MEKYVSHSLPSYGNSTERKSLTAFRIFMLVSKDLNLIWYCFCIFTGSCAYRKNFRKSD